MKIFWVFLFFGAIFTGFSQHEKLDVLYYLKEGNDTIPVYDLPTITVKDRVFSSKKEKRRYDRLVSNILKVYPYAKVASLKLEKYAPLLDSFPSKSSQRQYMEIIEKELWSEYGYELRQLTFSQGKILLKLVDRETKKSSYTLIKEFRGSIRAFFYQGIAGLWDYDLKVHYDAEGEDKVIEEIVQKIEKGCL